MDRIQGRDHDDFVEFVDFVNAYDDYPAMERVLIRDQENPLEALSNSEFVHRYHLSKDIINQVLPLVHPRVIPAGGRGTPLPTTLKLLAFIRYLSSGSFQLTCGDLLGISQPTVCNTITEMADTLSNHCGTFIKMPTNETLRGVHMKFYDVARFPGVSGVIDCTHIWILSPGGDAAEVFRDRKGHLSLNVQFVAGPDLEFYNIVCRWPGSAHDTRIFDSSYIKMEFEQGVRRGILLGDSGYPQRNYLFTPVQNPQARAEHAYNKSLKTTRNIVERAFGVMKRKFPILGRRLQNKLVNAINIIISCAILHNMARLENIDAYEQYEDEPVPLEDVIADDAVGRDIRNRFIVQHFR